MYRPEGGLKMYKNTKLQRCCPSGANNNYSSIDPETKNIDFNLYLNPVLKEFTIEYSI